MANPAPPVSGALLNGVDIPGGGLLVGGSDGTSYRHLKTDGNGVLNARIFGTDSGGGVAGTSAVLIGGVYNTVLPTYTNGQAAQAQFTSNGAIQVFINGSTFIPANADAASGSINGLAVSADNFIYNGTTWDRVKKPNSVSRLVSSANTTNATSVKASAGNLSKIIGLNTTAGVLYLKLYNKASAPTVGTDTPYVTIAIPASGQIPDIGADQPLYFSTGIAFALTGAGADADTTAVTAGAIVGLNLFYS